MNITLTARLPFQQQVQKMTNHFSSQQQVLLQTLFDQAMQQKHPRAHFAKAIESHTNVPNGWGDKKAKHITKDLLKKVPKQASTKKNKKIKQPKKSDKKIKKAVKKLGSKKRIQEIAKSGHVAFYKTGDTSFLGNFNKMLKGRSISIYGQNFLCAEAAFQWMKLQGSQDPRLSQFFTAGGEKAFQLSRQIQYQVPGSWYQGGRDAAMWAILQVKFAQGTKERKLLNATQNAYLLEHNAKKGRDNYWSDDHDGTGSNMLGRMLMAIRDGQQCPAANTKDVKTANATAACMHVKNIF